MMKDKDNFIKKCRNLDQLGLNIGLASACNRGILDEVKILLTYPEFRFHADIHCGQDSPFRNAYFKRHMEVIKFFIFDMNIDRTSLIDAMLANSPNEEVIKMFTNRLKKELDNELTNNDYQHKKLKV